MAPSPGTAKLLARGRGPFAVALLVLFVFGQIAESVHHTFVDHHICPVDGQLAHGSADHGCQAHGHGHAHGSEQDFLQRGPLQQEFLSGGDHAEAGSSERAAQPGGHALAAEGGSCDHGEHCAFPTTGGKRKALLSGGAGVAQLLAPAPPSVVRARAQAERQVPLLSLAPKQSPPRTAHA